MSTSRKEDKKKLATRIICLAVVIVMVGAVIVSAVLGQAY